MPKLLIDEHPLLVLPSLAKAIGLPESIFLQQVHYWLESNGHLQDDGRRWIFNSYEAWSQQFPWWNVGTIRRIVATLRDAGLIETTTRYNRMGIDHTLWYTIDYTVLAQLTAPPPDPPIPADPPATPDPNPINPPAENDTSSAENDRRSAQNAQTIRAKCTDDPRKMRATITRDLLSETPTETSPDKVVVVDGDPLQNPISLEEKTRAPARATPPAPPFPDYETATCAPAAIDAALRDIAGLLDPDTRQSIIHANPDLTVEQILAWNSYRATENQRSTRYTGPGALIALLRTGAPPPRNRLDPAAAETWLITAGYLAAPEPAPAAANPPIPPSASPIAPDPDPAANALWQPVLNELNLSHRAAYDNWLRHTTATAYDPDTGHLTITVKDPQSQQWLEQRMNGTLTQRLQRIAGRPIHLRFQLPP